MAPSVRSPVTCARGIGRPAHRGARAFLSAEVRASGGRHDRVLFGLGQQPAAEPLAGDPGDRRAERTEAGERRLGPEHIEEGQPVVARVIQLAGVGYRDRTCASLSPTAKPGVRSSTTRTCRAVTGGNTTSL